MRFGPVEALRRVRMAAPLPPVAGPRMEVPRGRILLLPQAAIPPVALLPVALLLVSVRFD